MKVYIIWLIGVLAWNFGVPNANPMEDVIVTLSSKTKGFGVATGFISH